MMGRKSGQMQIIMMDIGSLIPKGHLLCRIDRMVDFSFIYKEAEGYYSDRGRRSVDPVSLVKMLLIGYLYGIRSERRLEEEITLNIAYRWFCGFDLTDRIPDHSVFSQNRRRRFSDESFFRRVFSGIVMQCIEHGLVSGEQMVSDGTFIPANVSKESKVEMLRQVERSTVSYLDSLDQELKETVGYKEPVPVIEERMELKSSTDPDCGYIHQERKKGLGYLAQMTVDTDHGIITGVDCYPANRRESDIILRHIERQMSETGLDFKAIALDAGYDVGAVHRGFEHLGVVDYCSIRKMHNNAMKKGFTYHPETDVFICKKGKILNYERLIYKKATGYYRYYKLLRSNCKGCEQLEHCSVDKGSIRINASPFYPSYYANRLRCLTDEYQRMKRLRNIWSEGTFASLKNNHNLKRHRKRGISRTTEECLLSATALNLKRMTKSA